MSVAGGNIVNIAPMAAYSGDRDDLSVSGGVVE